MKRLAKEVDIPRESTRRIIHDGLNLRSCKYQSVRMITDKNKKDRLRKCKQMLTLTDGATLATVLFSDEKLIFVEAPHNLQNDPQLMPPGLPASGLLNHKSNSHFPKSVMVCGGIYATGKTPLVFTGKSANINAKFYQENILRGGGFVPWVRGHFGGGK